MQTKPWWCGTAMRLVHCAARKLNCGKLSAYIGLSSYGEEHTCEIVTVKASVACETAKLQF